MPGEFSTISQSVQLAKETTAGVAVPANKRLGLVGFNPTPSIPGQPINTAGNIFSSDVMLAKERSEGPVEGGWGYNDLPFVLCSNWVDVTPTTPSGATNTRLWSITPANSGLLTLATFTVERGNADSASRMVNAIVNSLTLRATEDETAVTGTLVGKQLTPGITLTSTPADVTPAVVNPITITGYLGTGIADEVQVLTLGAPSAGTFTITFTHPQSQVAQTTGNIVYTAANTVVQTALEGLTDIGVGGVTVAGSAGGPYTCTFAGRNKGINFPQMTVNGAGLTGGSVANTTTTSGGFTKMARLHEWQLQVNDRVTTGYTLDASEPSWTYAVERRPDASATMVIQHNAFSQAVLADMKTATTNYLKVQALGRTIETGFRYSITFNIAAKFRELNVDDRNDVQAATYQITPVFDPTAQYAMQALLYNTQASI